MFKIFADHQDCLNIKKRVSAARKQARNDCDIIIFSFFSEGYNKKSKVYVDLIICNDELGEEAEKALREEGFNPYVIEDSADKFGFNYILSLDLFGSEAKDIAKIIAKRLRKRGSRVSIIEDGAKVEKEKAAV